MTKKVYQYSKDRDSGDVLSATANVDGVGCIYRFKGFTGEWQTQMSTYCKVFRSAQELEEWTEKLGQLVQIAEQMEQDPKLNEGGKEMTRAFGKCRDCGRWMTKSEAEESQWGDENPDELMCDGCFELAFGEAADQYAAQQLEAEALARNDNS